MGWDAQNQSDFVGNNLGPTLEAKGFGAVNIMIMDDQRRNLPDWATTVNIKCQGLKAQHFCNILKIIWNVQVLANPAANKYVSGIAVHWYGNLIAPPSVLTDTHNLYPDRFILATEACEGIDSQSLLILIYCWPKGNKSSID